ncbi:MAG TPA: hypothetical protein VIZ90_14580 [Rhizobiaceae bacterium]
MADEAKPRAVSGEIMTDPLHGATGGARPAPDVIDAEYISLPSRPHRVGSKSSGNAGSIETARPIGSPVAPAGGMDMLRRPDMPPGPRRPARGGPLFWAAGIALAFAAFWASGGHALLRDMPFAAPAAPQGALRISGVTSRVDTSGVNAILFVDGEAANDGQAVMHLPALEIVVTGNDGRTTRYRLGTSGRPLSSGETFAFSSRLDVPKNGVKTVSVAFAE